MKQRTFLTALLAASIALGGVFFGFDAPKKASAAASSSLTETYRTETALIDPPTVVYDVRTSSALTRLQASLNGERPSNAILHVGDGVITDGGGEAIGSLSETVESIRQRVIPILSVETQAEADTLIAFYRESGLIDSAVLSRDAALVKRVRDACPSVRGILEIDSVKSDYDCVKNASLCGAGTILLDEADYARVTYLQSRFKAVWVRSEDEFDDLSAITSGAVGIVTEDFSATYATINGFTEKTHARMPFNVAHRGLPTTHNENSVSGTKAAIEAGATHVELDGKLTTDGEIVMMHDDSIDRTTDGTGSVENMTLAEAKSHLLDLHSPHEAIPTLGELIPLFEGTDAVLVFEIKTKNIALIARLKQILDETGFYEHIVVIAFDYPNLEEMRRLLPEVPTADLNSYSEENFAQKLPNLGKYSCAISTNGSSTREFNENYLRDRGVIGWYWTQETESAVDAAFEKGLVGLTNNVGAYFGAKNDIYRVVLGSRSPEMGPLSVGASIPVQAVKYDGTVVEGTGEVAFLRENAGSLDPRDPGHYDVIAKYVSGDMTYFTPAFLVEREREPQDEKQGCFSTINLSSIPAALVLLTVGAGLCIRKKDA